MDVMLFQEGEELQEGGEVAAQMVEPGDDERLDAFFPDELLEAVEFLVAGGVRGGVDIAQEIQQDPALTLDVVEDVGFVRFRWVSMEQRPGRSADVAGGDEFFTGEGLGLFF